MFCFMVRSFLRRIEYYYITILDHVSTDYKRLFLGRVGKGSVIRRHVKLEGDSLLSVEMGCGCSIDTYTVIGCRKRLIRDGEVIIPTLKIGNGCTIGQYNHITAVNNIEIGDNLLTGRFVLISDNNHSGSCL